jgi:hypothetical protein
LGLSVPTPTVCEFEAKATEINSKKNLNDLFRKNDFIAFRC